MSYFKKGIAIINYNIMPFLYVIYRDTIIN